MVVRAVAIEWRRSRSDRYLFACLGLTILPTVSILGSLPDDAKKLPAEALALLADPLSVVLLTNVALIAAAFGSIRTSIAFASGIVGRDSLALQRGLPLLMRGISAGLAGSLLGAVVWGVAALGVRLIASVEVVDVRFLAPAVIVGLWGGMWGFAVGSIVRSPLFVLLVTFLTLSPALLLATIAPDAVELAPLGSLLSAIGSPLSESGVDQGMARVIAAGWVVALLLVALVSFRLRPRIA
ncbi:hypothetical protein C5C31_09285 [Rathayibacter rathayi]|nr:hypothetical protein C5C02_09525 [Rathayibacter rathayi]PPG76571.1 hypothetical protein C5C23_07530 [Rathayibacter rathayi]PPH22259.1 hypothetical protein C5C31_09285 [Rathayibacter rathayi]PPH36989.1 hypothetical protein C5C28_04790 [Rathayibacter rathayi]PPH64279.1 hypothetical protein C5C45_12835 [Rathayibacter rathayi]